MWQWEGMGLWTHPFHMSKTLLGETTPAPQSCSELNFVIFPTQTTSENPRNQISSLPQPTEVTLNWAALSWRTPSMQNYRHCNIYMPEVLNYLSLLQLISYFRPTELWSCNAGSCSAAYLGRWALACCERGV